MKKFETMVHRGWFGDRAETVGMERQALTPVIAGALVSDLARARMTVPARVRLGPDRLEWIPGTEESLPNWWSEGEPANQALWGFMKLATEDDGQRFVDFARRFGVLGLTEGGFPCVSPMVPGMMGPGQLSEPWYGFAVSWESIPAWRVYAANAKAIVHLAAEFRRGTSVNVNRVLQEAGLETDPLRGHPATPTWGDDLTKSKYIHNLAIRRPTTLAVNLQDRAHDLASQRQWLARWITDYWIAHSALIPTITWQDDRPRLCLPIGAPPAGIHEYHWPPNMLFNVLAAHLATFICSGEPVAQCSLCGELHPRPRAPRADQPNYCNSCAPMAERARKRAWKARHDAHERERIPRKEVG